MAMTAWKGGDIPVSRYADVKVRLADGSSDTAPAGSYDWAHNGGGSDIVAYEVLGGVDTPPLEKAGLGDSHQALTFGRIETGGCAPPVYSFAVPPHAGLAFNGSLTPAKLTPPASTSPLPVDAKARKALPVFSGFVRYFPDAMVEVAELSRVGNDQHNPGKPLFWDRSKSGDELDALTRHLIDAGTFDSDGVRHSTKVAWRAMANLQKEIERSRKEAP